MKEVKAMVKLKEERLKRSPYFKFNPIKCRKNTYIDSKEPKKELFTTKESVKSVTRELFAIKTDVKPLTAPENQILKVNTNDMKKEPSCIARSEINAKDQLLIKQENTDELKIADDFFGAKIEEFENEYDRVFISKYEDIESFSKKMVNTKNERDQNYVLKTNLRLLKGHLDIMKDETYTKISEYENNTSKKNLMISKFEAEGVTEIFSIIRKNSEMPPKGKVFATRYFGNHRRKSNKKIKISNEEYLPKGNFNHTMKSNGFINENIIRGLHETISYIPPKSPYNLIQEKLYTNPWKLLVATIFLHKTSGNVAIPKLMEFFKMYDDPLKIQLKELDAIQRLIQPLGLHQKRAKLLVLFTNDYIHKNWKYPIELYGIGKYGNDSYRMFCLGQWKQVKPTDVQLMKYHSWLKKQNELKLIE